MAESGKTVRILFPDGHERVFHNAIIETSVEGWLHVVRLSYRRPRSAASRNRLQDTGWMRCWGGNTCSRTSRFVLQKAGLKRGKAQQTKETMAEMEMVTESDIRYIQRDPTPEGVIYLHPRKSAAIVRHGQHVWKHAYLTGKRSVQAFCSASAWGICRRHPPAPDIAVA